jgi:metallo-beta-lactamase family protein
MSTLYSQPQFVHHGAVDGVTGSCHEYRISDEYGLLVDCGLFQGAELSKSGSSHAPKISFAIDHIRALIVTNVHIDHVGRIPYLFAAGYNGPIHCTKASATLLPLVMTMLKPRYSTLFWRWTLMLLSHPENAYKWNCTR